MSIDDGIVPTRLRPNIFMRVILAPLHATKCHEQISRSGIPLVHLHPRVNLLFVDRAAAKSHMKAASLVTVGDKVGNRVVGLLVGFAVGSLEGIPVGVNDGQHDGRVVGCTDGSSLGGPEGKAVGLLDG